MQISGYSSLSEYYAELAKLRSQSAGKSSAADIFGKADSDGDGGVSKSEFAALFSQAQDSGAASEEVASTESAKLEGRPPPPPPKSAEELEDMFTQADVDGDGMLSSEEFSALEGKMRPPQEGAQQNNGATGSTGSTAAELMSLLQNSSSRISLNGWSNDSSSTSMFSELLKTLNGGDGSASSGYTAYMQNLLKSAYAS